MPTAFNAVLFRWEDSPSLRHHCGFCDRPLSHPGARSSCFGVHCEPCIRFHQAMFMRNRGHTCASCIGADEAHYKRHAEIAETLRSIYELCNLDTSLCASCPSSDGVERETQSPELDYDDSKSDATSEERVIRNRKERKKMKRLARAASRPRILTQQEIAYVGDVLHPADDTSGNGDGPRNVEEIEEIERNLHYNAKVYNQGVPRRVLRSFGALEIGSVDFDAEMQRILSALKITELQLKNEKNKGLQGKTLRKFDFTVASLRKRIVEDLVLIKKEELEVRMRRAGYFRYTIRASNEIIEERHRFRDWRTGLRIQHSDDDNDDDDDDEPATPESAKLEAIHFQEQSHGSLQTSPNESPDVRHLKHGHKRVTSKGYVEEEATQTNDHETIQKEAQRDSAIPTMKIVLPNEGVKTNQERSGVSSRTLNCDSSVPAPRWSVTATPSKQPQNKITSHGTTTASGYSIAEQERDDDCANDGVDLEAAIPASLSDIEEEREPQASIPWHQITTPKQVVPSPIAPLNAIPPLSTNQRLNIVSDVSLSHMNHVQSDDQLLLPSTPVQATEASNAFEHPPISQKKAKKARQEAKRKGKKQIAMKLLEADKELWEVAKAEEDVEKEEKAYVKDEDQQGEITSGTALDSPIGDTHTDDNQIIKADIAGSKADTALSPPLSPSPSSDPNAKQPDTLPPPSQALTLLPEPPSTPRVLENKFKDWNQYDHQLDVDRLSKPFLDYSCVHVCPCRNTGRKDCQFHQPSHCINIANHLVSIVYVSVESWSLGPYNKLRAAKLLKFLNMRTELRGKMLLVDSDLLPWLKTCRGDPPPTRLLEEYQQYWRGTKSGPLMKQEADYDTLCTQNANSTTQLQRPDIQKLVESLEPAGRTICYCQMALPSSKLTSTGEINDEAVLEKKNIIECSFKQCEIRFFHRDCVGESNPHLVTRWYCLECEKEMSFFAFAAVSYLDKPNNGCRERNMLPDHLDDEDGSDLGDCDECMARHWKTGLMRLFAKKQGTYLMEGQRF